MTFVQYLIDRIISSFLCNRKKIKLNWAEEEFFEKFSYLNLKLILNRLGKDFCDSYSEFNGFIKNKCVKLK